APERAFEEIIHEDLSAWGSRRSRPLPPAGQAHTKEADGAGAARAQASRIRDAEARCRGYSDRTSWSASYAFGRVGPRAIERRSASRGAQKADGGSRLHGRLPPSLLRSRDLPPRAAFYVRLRISAPRRCGRSMPRTMRRTA